MIEKRFEFREVNCSAIIPKVYDNEKQQYANLFECVDWLNDLYEENEKLKKDCSNLIDDNTEYVSEINQLAEENEKLKKILGFLRNDNATDILNVLNYQENQIWELKEENEELKQFKEDVFDLIDKEIIQNEEAIEWGNEWGADVGAIGFYTNMLKILRKELQK